VSPIRNQPAYNRRPRFCLGINKEKKFRAVAACAAKPRPPPNGGGHGTSGTIERIRKLAFSTDRIYIDFSVEVPSNINNGGRCEYQRGDASSWGCIDDRGNGCYRGN
jgi:hypothetical protein